MGEPELNDIWAESVIKLQAENAQLKARLAYQDKWLSNGIYYTNKEADELLGIIYLTPLHVFARILA